MSEKLLNRRNRWIIAGATGVLLVGGSAALATTAFADDGDSTTDNGAQVADDDDNDGDDDGDDGDDDATPSTKPKVSLADATATASDEVSKGILTSIELEGSNDAPVWRVDFITSDGTEHEVSVDALKGDVTDHNKDADDDSEDWDEAKAVNDKVKTSPDDAATAAFEKVGKSGAVTSVELDDDGSNAQWDVEVTTKDGKHKDVTVDAVSGKATDVYTDDDNDSDDANDDDGDHDDDNGDDDANDNDGDND